MNFKTYKRMGLKWTMKHFRWCIIRTIRVYISPKRWATRLYAIRNWRPGSKISFQEYEDLYPFHVQGRKLYKELSELNNELNKEE